MRCTETKPTLVSEQEGGEGEDEDADDGHASKPKSPEEKAKNLLEKGPDQLWALKPLPESKPVLSADIALALHIYITQQWSMVVRLLL